MVGFAMLSQHSDSRPLWRRPTIPQACLRPRSRVSLIVRRRYFVLKKAATSADHLLIGGILARLNMKRHKIALKADYPRIFGRLLDTLVVGWRHRPFDSPNGRA